MNPSKVTSIDVSAGSAQTVDRRRSERERLEVRAWLSAEAGTRGTNFQVVVNDLSLHGVGFKSESAFDAGSIHWIILGGGLRASSRLRIASCRERQDGEFDCGAEFF